MDSTYILEAAGRFHGHIGPWLALGVRAGLRAWEKLGVRYQDLVACVRCPDRTPYTCFLDGIQFSSGCTMGKGNIRHQAAEGCAVVFSTSDWVLPGRTLELKIAPSLWAELHEARQFNDRQATLLGYDVFGRPIESILRERFSDRNSETSNAEHESK